MDTDTRPLARIDSFPYRHRVADLMSSPPLTVDPAAPATEAARLMLARRVSSLLVLDGDGRPAGIVTERDMLRALCACPADPGRVADLMTSPVAFVRADAFVYMALGRMARLGLRHLAVIDGMGRAVGVISARDLLRLRSGQSLQLGDRLRTAETAADMATVRAELPALAAALLAEAVEAREVAAVISAVYRDMTRRAAQLAEAALAGDPAWGPPPAPYAVLVLGSGGRGESLLAPDQDNALVHRGGAGDDPWFAELGRRMTDLLDAAGLPYCPGGVMASRPDWRHHLDGWRQRIGGWIGHPESDSLLMVDIFYDLQPVFGDAELAATLQAEALEAARRARGFLAVLGAQLEALNPPLGLFGRFRLDAEGRLDLKLGGLLPVVQGARVMALQHGLAATATRDRLDALAAAGVLTGRDHAALTAGHALLLDVVLRQQIDDLRGGRAAGTRVDPRRFPPEVAARVKDAVRAVDALRMLVRDGLQRAAVSPPSPPRPAAPASPSS